MVRIINNTETILQPDIQDKINQACAWAEYEGEVTISIMKEYDEGTIFNVCDENGNLLFTVDTDGAIAN